MKPFTTLFILLNILFINYSKAQSKLRIYLPNTCENIISSDIPTSYNNNLFELFPNPTNGLVNIDFTQALSGKVNIKIIDLRGIIIKTEVAELSGRRLIIDIFEVPKGIYILKIFCEEKVGQQKIIIN